MLLSARPALRAAVRLTGARRVACASVSTDSAPPPIEINQLDTIGDSAPTWSELQGQHVTCLSAAVGKPGAATIFARATASSRLSAETALDCIDDPSVMNVFTDAFDGQLAVCVSLVDAHLRLLSSRLLSGNASRTTAAYAALEALPPMLRRQHTSAAAAVRCALRCALRCASHCARVGGHSFAELPLPPGGRCRASPPERGGGTGANNVGLRGGRRGGGARCEGGAIRCAGALPGRGRCDCCHAPAEGGIGRLRGSN